MPTIFELNCSAWNRSRKVSVASLSETKDNVACIVVPDEMAARTSAQFRFDLFDDRVFDAGDEVGGQAT
jgi:hypothetical protein